jgi:uncharacterized protein YggU (UPF0235/DUF167 family)
MKARLTLKVRAGARRTEFAGHYETGGAPAWKLNIAALPVDGKANQAVVRFLSRLAGIPSSSVRIVSGAMSSNKIVELDGISPDALQRAILESHGPTTNTGSIAPTTS